MKLYLNQLANHLKSKLAPVYFISGDETLLVQEARDALLASARKQGYSELEYHNVDKSFNWNSLYGATHNLSLFGEKTVVELRMQSAKPGVAGAKALASYVSNPVADKILLIITPKLESSTSKTKWYKSIDEAGVTLPIWPIDTQALGKWTIDRMRAAEISTDQQGVKIIIDATEGNLLATAQEIEKLRLLYGAGTLSSEQIATAIADNARFDVYQFVDTIHKGNGKHVIRVLNRLHQEGTEPMLINWALTREIRLLINVMMAIKTGAQSTMAMRQNGVWDKRQPLIKHALAKHKLSQLQKMLLSANDIDMTVKGLRKSNVWDELAALALKFSGVGMKAVP